MYTSCPECGTVFRISTNELRVAEGHVRCGHCSATFNALATLVDELPPTVTLKQPSLPAEPGSRTAEAPVARELQAATDYAPLPIAEDTLEFDIPEERWSNFFEASGPATAEADSGTDAGSDTVDQLGIDPALAAEGRAPGAEDDGDWQTLLEEVQEDAGSPDQVYVIADGTRADSAVEPLGERGLPATSGHGPLPADLAADLPDAPADGPAPLPRQGTDPGMRTDERPFLWRPQESPADVRGSRHWAYTAGSVVLLLLLLIQVLHQQRDELATNPALTEVMQRTYAALGLPLWPAWDLQAYELRNSEAVADRSSRGALDILARIAVVGNDPVGLPLVRVTLRDRLSRPLGTRVFKPEEYIRAKSPIRSVVSPGTQIPVEISLQDPGADAQGFDVDVCIMSRRDGIVCRVDREPFVR